MMESEEWRTIAVAPNYAVSNFGNVKRQTVGPGTWPGRPKKPTVNAYGYLVVNLVDGGRKRILAIHRLVCIAFHGPPPSPKHEATHRDNDRRNDRASNLHWKLPVDNAVDRLRRGTHRTDGRKLTPAQVKQIRADGRPQRVIASEYGVMPAHISRLKTGVRGGPI